MKFISWNIDSLNAALTSDSPRALLTREVLKSIAAEDADIIAIQETKLPAAGMNAKQKAALEKLFPDYETAWNLPVDQQDETGKQGMGREDSIWNELNVIGVTPGIYNDTVAITTAKPEINNPEFINALQTALINIINTEEGQAIFSVYSHTGYAIAQDSDYDAARQALARKFEQEMETQLRDLNMGGTRFQVALPGCAPGPLGRETAAFLIAPNRGEELQALSKIASGGELSRLMLAIKSVAARREGVPSMIFDEIDTGISGRAAQVVGEKMAMIARERQVLCVTHLQQIAALADHHFLVEKFFDGQRTRTRLTPLEGEDRVNEIARMLGGDAESARAHAREMLRQAR